MFRFFRHDDLIIRNGLYADMWSEQRKSTSDLPTNDVPTVSTNVNETSTNHHDPLV